jgi:tRNA nucleotidyltransferase (CCA-adding enzyme)
MSPEFPLLRESLPRERLQQLRLASRVARQLRMPVYLIGGSVRDLLLGVSSPDLDLCAVGDGIAFAQALARELGAPVSQEWRFLTAKIAAAGGSIDVATARRETYPRPGALPRVTPGSIEDDLARRDFTVNAMAVRLDLGPRRLLDPFGGCADLAQRRLRVLYDHSFNDDPTRLLRAARYAARLGFRLERKTGELAEGAVRSGCLGTVSGDRIRRELLMLLDERGAWAGVKLCARLGVLRRLHPSLRIGPQTRVSFGRAQGVCDWLWQQRPGANLDFALVRLLLISGSLSPGEGRELSHRLRLAARQARALAAYLTMRGRARRVLSRPGLHNSALVRAPEGLPLESVAAIAAESSPLVRSRCKLFLGKLAGMRPRIRGEDLARLGFAPGPAWGRALAAARNARLDGRARTKEEELRVAAAVLRRAGRA